MHSAVKFRLQIVLFGLLAITYVSLSFFLFFSMFTIEFLTIAVSARARMFAQTICAVRTCRILFQDIANYYYYHLRERQ